MERALYKAGKVTEIDWYRNAADQGYAHAQTAIGKKYFYGQGVVQDYSKAKKYLQNAVNQGYAPAGLPPRRSNGSQAMPSSDY
ncbi:MAG: hypothetical protein ACREYE_24335 [Gammaproteobacteria bacterium]